MCVVGGDGDTQFYHIALAGLYLTDSHDGLRLPVICLPLSLNTGMIVVNHHTSAYSGLSAYSEAQQHPLVSCMSLVWTRIPYYSVCLLFFFLSVFHWQYNTWFQVLLDRNSEEFSVYSSSCIILLYSCLTKALTSAFIQLSFSMVWEKQTQNILGKYFVPGPHLTQPFSFIPVGYHFFF